MSNAQEGLFTQPGLISLDPHQQGVVDVVARGERHVRVAAAAGSGKTRVIIACVLALLRAGVPPEDIVVTTFTRKAADELTRRLGNVGVARDIVNRLRIGTFHSVAIRALAAKGEEHVDMPRVGDDETPRWSMERCISVDQARLGITAKDLWRQIVDWAPGGKIAGTGDTSLGEKKHEPAEYQRAVDWIRCRGMAYGSDEAKHWINRNPTKVPPQLLRAWGMYEAAKRALGGWDFQDAIEAYGARLAQRDAPRFALVDEGQDTDVSQKQVILAWAGAGAKIVLLGDARQCVPLTDPVLAPGGYRPIGEIRPGMTVTTSQGGSEGLAQVHAVFDSHQPKLIRFTTNTGRVFRLTPGHAAFAGVGPIPGHYVYLMYRHDMGFRIGSTHATGSKNGRHLIVRTQQEEAERLWILYFSPDERMARQMEHRLAYQYGVPMVPFKARQSSMFAIDEEALRWFSAFGPNGFALLDHMGLEFDRPAYFAKASHRGVVNINVTISCRKGHSEVAVDSAHVPDGIRATYRFRPGKSTWRLRRQMGTAQEALAFAYDLRRAFQDVEIHALIVETLAGCWGQRLFATQAASIHPGMQVPVPLLNGNRTETIVAREEEHGDFSCRDLEVTGAANFLVNGVAVHNSIYGFRGADPDVFLGLDTVLDMVTLSIPTNYRSVPEVVDLGTRLAGDAAWAKVGDMPTANRGRAKRGAPVTFMGLEDTIEEAQWVMADIAECRRHGGRFDDIAILTRTNMEAALFEGLALEQRIPVLRIGSGSFWTSYQVLDFQAYAALSEFESAVALERIYNRPKRFLRRDDIRLVVDEMHQNRRTVLDALGHVAKVRGKGTGMRLMDLQKDIKALRALDWPSRCTRIARMLTPETEEAEIGAEDLDSKKDVPRLVATLGAKFPSAKAFIDYAEACAQNVQFGDKQDARGRVTISTIHRAKGLEYKRVYVSATDGALPHARSCDDAARLEEEQRLFYVAVTRAEDNLVVTWARHHPKGGGPSRFLKDFVEVP